MRDREREQREQVAATSDVVHLDGGDEARLVQSILDGLPRTQRTVMALTMSGYSSEEIASMLGSSRDTVRSNLRHARRAMANELRRAGWKIDYYVPRQAG